MENLDLRDRIRGCLVGGAIGDALGYPVEFDKSYQVICNKYGDAGITRYVTDNGSGNMHKAYISDDTQMTLFVACAVLGNGIDGHDTIPSINRAYVEWLMTQKGKRIRNPECWVSAIPEMYACRAPGITCRNSIERIRQGQDPMNDSKGAGGLMRIAPIPLYGVAQGRVPDIHKLAFLAAETSEQTHLHPLGYIPSFVAAWLICRLAGEKTSERRSFSMYIKEALDAADRTFSLFRTYVGQLRDKMELALSLASGNWPDHKAISQIGEGFMAEETLAIAVYCTYKYWDDFEKSIVASVNHGGDSDTTGAVTGNIHGAVVGYDAIPEFFKHDLELHDVILHVADDLWRGENTKFKNND